MFEIDHERPNRRGMRHARWIFFIDLPFVPQ
jgi:hypothetical protein